VLELGLEGKVALVAGGSTGIGKAIALALAREGVKVAISARGKEELEKTAQEINLISKNRALAIQADMTSLEDIKRFVNLAANNFGSTDILVYCANSPGGGKFSEITDEAWNYHISVKLLGCIRCVREVLPHMSKNHWGRIVIISGTSARVIRPKSVDNGPICAGLSNFGKQVSNEVAGQGILVNTIHPGSTNTERHEIRVEKQAKESGITAEEVLAQERSQIPIGRIIEPQDIAYLTLFLCSQWASAITGQSIAVDGGGTAAVGY
jgi:3-oxoacyl-[acyl-carrier protein] reductase